MGYATFENETHALIDCSQLNHNFENRWLKGGKRDDLQRSFFGPANGYSMQGSGHTDLYKLFCERYASLARSGGQIGVVLPRVAFLNDGSRGFRQWLFTKCRPTRVDTLLNKKSWAFPIHPQFQIALLTAAVGVPVGGSLLLSGPSVDESQFFESSASEGVAVKLSEIALATTKPEKDARPSYELPLLQTQRHVDVLTKLQQGVRFDTLQPPAATAEATAMFAPPHQIQEINETNQKPLFRHPPGPGRVPVWKGRNFDQYDPHGRVPAGNANWEEVLSFVHTKSKGSKVFKGLFPSDVLNDPKAHPINGARIAFRDVARATDSRTAIACLIPPEIPLAHTSPYLVASLEWNDLSKAAVLAILNSLSFDWLARRYVESHLTYFILNSLRFPDWDNTDWQRIGELAARLSCVDDRFADFAAEAGVEYGPLTDAQRDDMRAEIDALVAHGYGLDIDELQIHLHRLHTRCRT